MAVTLAIQTMTSRKNAKQDVPCLRRGIAAQAVALVLTGCAVGPDFRSPALPPATDGPDYTATTLPGSTGSAR